MNLNRAACYRAVLARDARQDGRFFTCVRTTGIYCRPICPARPPKLENCRFVATAAAAQKAGFRACLRCRPESAPDLDAWRGSSATVSRALRLIEGGALDEEDVAGLAARLEIGERHLRRLFRQHLGATPVTVAQTRRVLLARQLMHETDLSLIEVALASGFGSVRRFNETFQHIYRRSPREMRRRRAAAAPAPEIKLWLPYRPPYDWEGMIRFLEARTIPGLEMVKEGTYRRVIELGNEVGWIAVTDAPEKCALRVAIRFPRLNLLPGIIARVRRMFDLSADPEAIQAALATDAELAPLVRQRPGLRVPGGWDGFEVAVRAVLGQQITLKAATTLAGRVVEKFGRKVEVGVPGLSVAFPRPEGFRAEALGGFGIVRTRVATLVGLAAAVRGDENFFDPRGDLNAAVARLREIGGIGEWTAQYIAMRALGESDAFLASDVGVQRGLAAGGKRPTERELLARAENWRPWRAYAVLQLWMADGETQKAKTKPGKEVHDALVA